MQTAQITVFPCTAPDVDFNVDTQLVQSTRLVSPECITVTIVDDTIADPGESFRVLVSTSNTDRVSFSNGVSEATINIINDDGNLDTYNHCDCNIPLCYSFAWSNKHKKCQHSD